MQEFTFKKSNRGLLVLLGEGHVVGRIRKRTCEFQVQWVIKKRNANIDGKPDCPWFWVGNPETFASRDEAEEWVNTPQVRQRFTQTFVPGGSTSSAGHELYPMTEKELHA